jgi:NAD(P)-dependent dehydrogenase (short-subunit alcohol dehydrogenase family)
MNKLSGKVAVITGGISGIGLATAKWGGLMSSSPVSGWVDFSVGKHHRGVLPQDLRRERQGAALHSPEGAPASERWRFHDPDGFSRGRQGTPSFGVYAASKAAIRSFVRTWTVELKDRRIRSNVLSPEPVVTPQVAAQPSEAIARIE